MTLSLAQVEDQIKRAFAPVAYPGDDNICYDQSGGHLECREVADRFRGKHWRDITTRFLRREADSIFFLSPAGYAFFLPAFLLASLTDFRRADMVPINTVVSLSPSLSKSTPEEFAARIRELTLPQRRAVALFLDYLGKRHADDFPLNDPKIALDEFWSRYLG